jgi:hypothetical protein
MVKGEAALVAALHSEFSKATEDLYDHAIDCDEHAAVRRKYLASRRVEEVLAHFSPKLTAQTLVPNLLKIGSQLVDADSLDVASRSCFAAALTNLQSHTRGSDSYPEVDHVHDTARALVGRACCVARVALKTDPHLQHVNTVEVLLSALQVRRCLAQPAMAVTFLGCNSAAGQ